MSADPFGTYGMTNPCKEILLMNYPPQPTKAIVFYGEQVYWDGDIRDPNKPSIADLPDGCYIYGEHSRKWHQKRAGGIHDVPVDDVPKTLRAYALLIS